MWLLRRRPPGPPTSAAGSQSAPSGASRPPGDWWDALRPGSAPARLPSSLEGSRGGAGAARGRCRLRRPGAAGAACLSRRLAQLRRGSRGGAAEAAETRSCPSSSSRGAGSRDLARPPPPRPGVLGPAGQDRPVVWEPVGDRSGAVRCRPARVRGSCRRAILFRCLAEHRARRAAVLGFHHLCRVPGHTLSSL
ncbi:uncharacterized protein J5F26_009465 [Ciconia maguari]